MESKVILNTHLEPVFKKILPAITASKLKYWVYGGVAVAGIVGRFIRHNDDVDIFVHQQDFETIKDKLILLSQLYPNWKVKDARPKKRTGRPKFDLFVNDKEILSVVPIYQTSNGIEFRVTSIDILSTDIALFQVPHEINGNEFYCPTQDIVKAILKSFLLERPDAVLKNPKRRLDLEALFSPNEIREFDKLLAD